MNLLVKMMKTIKTP